MVIKFDDPVTSERVDDLKEAQEEQFLQFTAQKLGLQYVDLTGINIQTDALVIIPEEIARGALMAGFKKVGKELHIAMHSPENPDTKEELEKLAADYRIVPYLASIKSLEKAWSRYEDVHLTEQAMGGLVDISNASLEDIAQQIKSNDDVRALLREAASMKQGRTTRVIEIILGSAIATKSSDIHFEPQEAEVRLRFRQDGVLQDVATLTRDLYRRVISRIKILSQLKITNVRQAQDGRFTIEYNESDIEVRVSTVPSAYGESIVMRILDPTGLTVGFDELGIEPRLLEILKTEIVKPNGMILTTGPTGSGKTTTLYSFLKYIYKPDIKVITIEDPIEYHLEGISQTQVDHKKGYDFLAGLRAALRQDPDTIMVGEIRDNETATIAVNASLTGHMVFSTLHTNNAAGTIPRLLDLGVGADVLASALTVSLAQRLVRKLCPDCKQRRAATPDEKRLIQRVISGAKTLGKDVSQIGATNLEQPEVYSASGCETCRGSGYKGRIGVFEAILMDEQIQELLEHEPNERDVWHTSQHQKILNMAEDGIIKVLAGVTDMPEIQKVVDIEGYLDLLTKKEITYTPTPIRQEQQPTSTEPALRNQERHSGNIDELRRQEMVQLLTYLRTLEEHQRQHPEVGIAEKIYLARRSLLELLEMFSPNDLFMASHNDTHHGDTSQQIINRLEQLEHQQQQNPYQSAQSDLAEVRQYVENTQKP